MDFGFSEEQEMLKTMARDFLEKECPESLVREMEEDDEGFSSELWHKIADLGWLGLIYPDKYGGTGGSMIDMAVLYEEMGRAMLPSPHLSTVILCGLTILAAGSEAQKADLLPKIVSGNLILALALTEPETSWDGKSWDAEGVTVSATPDGDDYVINGTKLFVHDAHIADYLLCVTRTKDGADPEKGVTLFLVDAKSPGVSSTILKTTANDKQSEVVFDKVKVPKQNMVGELNEGWSPLAKVLQHGAVLLCAEMTGAGGRALEVAVDYAKTRIQFDMPIGIHQYIQEHCVEVLAATESSRRVTYQAAWKLSESLPSDMEVSIAKAWTNDAHEKACWHAHAVLGGVGATFEAGILPLYTRRAKTARDYLGDSAYHLKKVAEQVDKWSAPETPRGNALGLWDKLEEEQRPAWQPWQERWDAIELRKEERRKKQA